MESKVPASELDDRLQRFRRLMDAADPAWELAVVLSKINLYYFTGTMQDGMLLVPRDGEACLWVRRSYERAANESLFPLIRPMRSYRDAAAGTAPIPATVHLETEQVPLAVYQRLRKHFRFENVRALDREVMRARAVKSPYELGLMERAGAIHRRVLEDRVPEILREGMTEAELTSGLYTLMIEEGHHGIVRFGMSESEIVLGLIGFGESSIYPTYLDSPGGNAGMGPSAPLFGSRSRRLRDGDLVFIDVGCGYAGYHTDKTMTYVFGTPLPDDAVAIHARCVEMHDAIAALLRPGAVPSAIYEAITADLEPAFLENFMGFGNRSVQFLGHGIGLEVAECPTIARGSDEPLEAGMAIAVEPKKGIAGVGLVGTENTFVVAPGGGRSITGHHPGLMPVG
ncbi:MAG TPA: aminopeptidase P family protein [Methanoregulaceae archaeon]|nr:aminopeptidase P family protein [Methanoregulaceae archaeon]